MNKKIVIGITGLAVIALNSVVFYAASAANTPKSAATSSAIKAAKWNPTVKLTYSKSSVLMQPTGIPNHARDAFYAVPNAGVVVPDATTAKLLRTQPKPRLIISQSQPHQSIPPKLPTHLLALSA